MTDTATPEEVYNALALKAAAKADQKLSGHSISDWQFLQHAMIAKGKTAKALHRLRNMQALKQSYGVQGDGSLEDATRDLQTFQHMYPGFFRSMVQVKESRENEQERGLHVVCIDMSKATAPTTEEGHAVRIRVLFYLLHSLNATIPSMRAGYFHVMDCEAMTWRNFSFAVARRTAALYGGNAYPVRVRQIVGLQRSTALVLLFFRIINIFLPGKMRRRIEMVDKHKLESYFTTDPPFGKHDLAASWGSQVSEEALVETLLTNLQLRYANAAKFRLEPINKPRPRRAESQEASRNFTVGTPSVDGEVSLGSSTLEDNHTTISILPSPEQLAFPFFEVKTDNTPCLSK